MSSIPFNNARGAASSIQMSPPFSFSDVTMSVFPLRASLSRLETFCRNYLNQAPQHVQFRPFMPFVYLVILDYGRMSLEAANMGWVSQREVAFGVPLRWLNVIDNNLQFHDWAFTSPFIFVDNELSMSTGREVYGWPKLLARLDPSISEWVRDPHGARRVFQVSTKRATQAYAGQTQEYHPFLSVIQSRTAGLLDIPPSMDAVTKPLSQVSATAAGLTRLSADLVKTFTGMASDGITGSSVLPDMLDLNTFRAQLAPDKMKAWLSPKDWGPGIKDAMWSMFPRTYANTINFKQFRDAGDPHATCYQAITSAKMPVKSVKRGGLLGPQNMLLGQLDGGYRIDVHHLAGLPIVESLGLEVSEERQSDGSLVSSLSPVSPFWLQVDMTYGRADTLVWRGRQGDWKQDEALKSIKAVPNQSTELSKDPKAPSEPTPKKEKELKNPEIEEKDGEDDSGNLDYVRVMNFFNTARGATEAIGGAFNMPNASIRVLPLKADLSTLQKFVSEYLKVEGHAEFDAWGDFVYIVICDFDQMNSELNAVSKRRAREVNVVVPVKSYSYCEASDESDGAKPNKGRKKRERRLVTTGYVSAFSFVDDVGTAITASEVAGVPSMGANIISPENDWLSLDRSKDRMKRNILDTSAQVLPALMSGAQAQERSIIKLHSHTPPLTEVHESQHDSIGRWVGLLADDLESKAKEVWDDQRHQGMENPFLLGQGFALKLLGGDLPINQFSLKQFRDSSNTDDACYQGLVMRRHRITNLSDMRELEEPLHVSITDYPTQPISQILGLKPKLSYPGKDRTVNVFEAIRPFSLTADMRREAGDTLFERVGEEDWTAVDYVEQIFGWHKSTADEVADLINSGEVTNRPDPIELKYNCKVPSDPRTFQVLVKDLGRESQQKKFMRRKKDGKLSGLMLKDRTRDTSIGLLTKADLKKFLSSKRALDVAAFNEQVRISGKEINYPQDMVAQSLGAISPATILDAALSQQMGLRRGAKRRRFIKPYFCVPADTVANQFIERLFPHSELLHNYWPLTEPYYNDEVRRRNGEVVAIKSDLRAIFDLFFHIFIPYLEEEKGDTVKVLDEVFILMKNALTNDCS